jgi:hypothetical protein
MAKHIFRGSGAPNFIPEDVGHHYVDIVTKDAYLSVGSSTVNDWVIAAGYSVSNGIVVNTMNGTSETTSPSVSAIKSYISDQSKDITAKQYVVEYFTLNSLQVDNAAVVLADTPTSEDDVTFDVIGLGAQVLGDDYVVNGGVISWVGKELHGIFSPGDKIRITYTRTAPI